MGEAEVRPFLLASIPKTANSTGQSSRRRRGDWASTTDKCGFSRVEKLFIFCRLRSIAGPINSSAPPGYFGAQCHNPLRPVRPRLDHSDGPSCRADCRVLRHTERKSRGGSGRVQNFDVVAALPAWLLIRAIIGWPVGYSDRASPALFSISQRNLWLPASGAVRSQKRGPRFVCERFTGGQ